MNIYNLFPIRGMRLRTKILNVLQKGMIKAIYGNVYIFPKTVEIFWNVYE